MSGKSNVKVIFGAMMFGDKSRYAAVTVPELDVAGEMLDVFTKYGHKEVDTARMYAGGTSEEFLGSLHWQDRGLVMETKLFPTKGKNMTMVTHEEWTLQPADVRAGFTASLEALKADNVDMFYLHGPDRTVPFEETLREVDKLHKEGKFERFGVSNFFAWEVAQLCEIARKNGWIQPTVYQGVYNPINRTLEHELLPCLRHYGLALYAFQPLAGGFLTSRYTRNQTEYKDDDRFNPKKVTGKISQGRYHNDATWKALDLLREAAGKHGLTEVECTLRWLNHHSALKPEKGDGVIIGASRPEQLEESLLNFEKGPLPEDVVEAIENGWKAIKGVAPQYAH